MCLSCVPSDKEHFDNINIFIDLQTLDKLSVPLQSYFKK